MLEIQDLHVKFHNRDREAVSGVNLTIQDGEILGLVGESGSGKSVTAMSVAGLLPRKRCDYTGRILLDGQELLHADRSVLREIQGAEIGVVFQEPQSCMDPLMKIGPQVEETLRIHTQMPKEECHQRAMAAMAAAELPDPEGICDKYPHELSGGMLQRAMIAAAIVNRPKLLLLDEPTTALDVTIQAQILEMLKKLNRESGVSMLFISHNLNVVRKLCTRTAVMQRYNLLSVSDPTIWHALVIIVSFIAGSSFVMWMGEQVTEFGVGNGISIILFAGILSRVPNMVSNMITGVRYWNLERSGAEIPDNVAPLHPALIAVMIIGGLALMVFVVFINGAERRIPVQYAKRQVGRKMYGGQSTHLPMKVNMSGVLPIIFAQSIASLPVTIWTFIGIPEEETVSRAIYDAIDTQSFIYMIVYFIMIIGFSYFYSTIQFNPVEIANNLKKQGGFIPGFRPGKPTVDFIKKVLSKITLFGAIYLGIVAICPLLLGKAVGNAYLAIGGTSVIIVVGVALETVKALEAQMLMRQYKGFLE